MVQILRCASCGAPLTEDGPWCIMCGVRQEADPPKQNSAPVRAEAKPWTEQVVENTKRFYESLQLPTWEEMNSPELQGCAITQRRIVLNGAAESGKSANADTIIAHIIGKYGRKKVATQIVEVTKGEDFAQVLEGEWEKKPIQVIDLDDCTDKSFDRKEMLGRFWDFRHIMQQKTGFSRGLLVTIIVTHSFFKIPDQFRTSDVHATLFKDIPTSPKGTFHEQIFKQFIPEKRDRDRLLSIQEQRMRNFGMRGYAYWLRMGRPAGFIYLPQVEERKRSREFSLPRLGFPKFSGGMEQRLKYVGIYLLVGAVLVGGNVLKGNITGALFWALVMLLPLALILLAKRRRRD